MLNIRSKALTVALLSLLVISCKKDDLEEAKPEIEVGPTPTTNRSEQTKDSIFLYAKQVYLWNKDLPTYSVFNPRKFTSSSTELGNFEDELFAITQYPKNPSTGRSYEYLPQNPAFPKFSYIEDLVESGKISFNPSKQTSVDLDGKGNDFGISLAYVGTQANYKIYIRYTSPGSPAKKEGLGRGDVIETINEKSYGSNFSGEIDAIVNTLDANSIDIKGKRRDGTSFNLTLNKTKYTSSPIYKDTVLTVNSKKIGYLAYARFSSNSTSSPEFSRIFNKFSDEGVTDLVVDLRYNGGGFVSTAEELVNYIVPSSHNGKRMFVEFYNDLMQSGKATILKNQPARDQNGDLRYTGTGADRRVLTYDDFSYAEKDNITNIAKKGPLNNIQKVVFITGGGTASASELVINSLKPYMDVKLVGEKSYGKPVGFFPLRIDKYDVYYSMFETRNSANQGTYYDGFVPDSKKADDVTRDFGDRNEISLAAALAYITTGAYTTSSNSQTTMSINGKTKVVSEYPQVKSINGNEFHGMIGTPKKLK